jgi:anti-sigma factor RsiW
MTISDETLMAYADGELEPAAREAVESAMRKDPQLERRVAQHRALRQRVQAAYSAELAGAIPERLMSAAKGITRGRDTAAARRRWPAMGALAASVILGVGVGFLLWGRTGSPFMQSADGGLVARGGLAKALSNQLAAEQTRGNDVQIGVSFLAKSGGYCRTFVLSGAASPSGLACRHGAEWQIQTLSQAADGAVGGSEYRTAGTAMPAAILNAVEARIAGEPMDQAAEKAARQRGWIALEH